MRRTAFALSVILLVAAATGCRMCAHPFDSLLWPDVHGRQLRCVQSGRPGGLDPQPPSSDDARRGTGCSGRSHGPNGGGGRSRRRLSLGSAVPAAGRVQPSRGGHPRDVAVSACPGISWLVRASRLPTASRDGFTTIPRSWILGLATNAPSAPDFLLATPACPRDNRFPPNDSRRRLPRQPPARGTENDIRSPRIPASFGPNGRGDGLAWSCGRP